MPPSLYATTTQSSQEQGRISCLVGFFGGNVLDIYGRLVYMYFCIRRGSIPVDTCLQCVVLIAAPPHKHTCNNQLPVSRVFAKYGIGCYCIMVNTSLGLAWALPVTFQKTFQKLFCGRVAPGRTKARTTVYYSTGMHDAYCTLNSR